MFHNCVLCIVYLVCQPRKWRVFFQLATSRAAEAVKTIRDRSGSGAKAGHKPRSARTDKRFKLS